MSVEIQAGSPLAEAIQNAMQPKLVEMGWSTGGLDDNALAEYVLLLLVGGKTQDEIAREMAADILQLSPDNPGPAQFAHWLFEQIAVLSGQGSAQGQPEGAVQVPSQVDGAQSSSMTADAEMGDASGVADDSIPTGPKSMRNNAPSGPRDKRMLGHMKKAMDRTGDSMHRIRGGASGNGRINSHSRGPPNGPRAGARQGQGNRGFGGQGGMGQMGPANAFGAMTPQQQMQLMAMYEQQAQMMAQILSPQQQQQMFGSMPGSGVQPQQPGKSLFERVDKNQRRKNRHQNVQKPSGDSEDVSMELDAKPSPSLTTCRFNLNCTNPSCPYVHQSPAAPPGTVIDPNDICSFGAACKNKKCTGAHPSPAKRIEHQSEVDCKFYPHCTNPHCTFRHGGPTAPAVEGGNALESAGPLPAGNNASNMTNTSGPKSNGIPCRNGADCQTPGCIFMHTPVPCKFTPCLNPSCKFTHVPGQQRGRFQDKVWTATDGTRPHVSERQFVDDGGQEEELIIPGQDPATAVSAEADGVPA